MNKVLTIGAINIDIFAKSNNNLVKYDSNIGHIDFSVGGVAKNISENLSRLNVNVNFISCIGNDIFSPFIKDYFKKLNINISNSLYTEDNNGKYFALLDDNNDMLYGINDMNIINNLSKTFLESIDNIIDNYEDIIIDTNLSADSIAYILNKYKDKNIFIDAVSANKVIKLKNNLNNIFLLKGNIIEFETLLNIKLINENDFNKAIKYIYSLGVKNIVITNGDKDIYYNIENNVYKSDIEVIKPINTTGAGDAFMSGLIYGFINDYKIEKSIEFAKRLAKLTLLVNEANSKDINKNVLEDLL